MSMEMENLWDAMKDVHYRRTLNLLREELEKAQDGEEGITAALNRVVHVVHAEAGTFWYYDRFGDNRIHPKAVYGGGDLGDYTLKPGEGVAGKVIETGVSTIIPNCQKDPRWAGKADSKTGFVTRTMICVPMKIDGIVYGSLQIINKTDNLPFDERDLQFAEGLAEAAGTMLAERELLGNYAALSGRVSGDTVTFESIVCAPSMKAMEKALRKAICYQKLNRADQERVREEMRGIFQIFADAAREEQMNGTKQKRGMFGFLK